MQETRSGCCHASTGERLCAGDDHCIVGDGSDGTAVVVNGTSAVLLGDAMTVW